MTLASKIRALGGELLSHCGDMSYGLAEKFADQLEALAVEAERTPLCPSCDEPIGGEEYLEPDGGCGCGVCEALRR